MDEPIGIIGAGRLGQALARAVRRANRPVVISNSRGPDSLASVLDALGDGVTAGTTRDAARCSIVGLAVPWVNVQDALAGLSWTGQIIIDTTNAVLIPSLELVPLGQQTSSEMVAQLVPGARLVKAANTYAADLLGTDPAEAGGRRVLFLSGDDPQAKETVRALFDAAGFFPIDLGSLSVGGGLHQAGGTLSRHNLLRIPQPWETGNLTAAAHEAG